MLDYMSACVKETEHKDLHQWQDEECTEDLIYEVREAEKHKTRATQYLLDEECQGVCMYLCMCVCGPEHPWPLTGLVCLNVGKANSVLLQMRHPQCHED